MHRTSKVLLVTVFIIAGLALVQSDTKHVRDPRVVNKIDPDSYAVYSAFISQHYQHSFEMRIPLKIAGQTAAPDRNHGDLMTRCTAGADSESDRELIKQLLSGNAPPQKLEAKLTVPGRYLIVEGKAEIKEGKEPGVLWLSAVAFSQDRRHAMLWVRNYCGALCGSGMMWKLDRAAKGWRLVGLVRNCDFIS